MIDSYVKTKKGKEHIKAYTVTECTLPMLTFKELQRNHNVKKYASDFAVFDTETSHIDLEYSWIYQWAFKIKSLYVYGRTPTEFIKLLQKMAEHYKLTDKKRLIIYIHNLSYDYCYIKHYLREYDPTIDILAIDNHAVLQVDVLGFRFLCSYKLTNLSLAKLSDAYAKTYVKAVGEIDYTKVRFQDSNLTTSDWFYMFSDVASQEDGIKGYLSAMGYKYAYNAPITSTGFVRAACRAAAKRAEWRSEFQQSALNIEQYNLCRLAFMGGVTIASFKHSNKTIRSDKLRHKDFTSSYPARQKLDYFPRGSPIDYGSVDDIDEFNELLSTYCCIFILDITDVHIKQGITAPYIPFSKCLCCEDALKVNGKVVYSSNIRIAITELDYEIIKSQYTWDEMRVGNMLLFERGKCPAWLTDEVMEYFKNKCTLKGVDDELYMKAKAFLNAIFGMTATAPIRETFAFKEDEDEEIDKTDMIMGKVAKSEDEQRAALSKFYKSHNSFMPYQFGVYTTAHARYALYKMIESVGYDDFLYCDTDSVFYLETPENKKRMDAYAEQCKQRAIDGGAYVGENYLGLPTDEPPLRAFRCLHAKCYAMEEYDKDLGDYDLKVTIAGIPKKATKFIKGKAVTKSNAQELKSIDNLKDGFIFKHCGGSRAIYNEMKPQEATIKGHKIELASSCIIDNIDKEVNDTMWTKDGYELYMLHYGDDV